MKTPATAQNCYANLKSLTVRQHAQSINCVNVSRPFPTFWFDNLHYKL